MNNTVIFYTDGAYSSTKQKGGWGLYCPQYKLKMCHGEYNTTNNRMEMTAEIRALEFVDESKLPEKNIIIYSDSKYLIETMKGNYSMKTNIDLWDKLNDLKQALFDKNITWIHVKGHSGHIENEIVDQLANLASQN